MMHLCKRLLRHIGLAPERLRLEWVSASEGSRYAEVMNDFSSTIKSLGPIGPGEGIDLKTLRFRLQTALNLVPYIKLVERERLRVRFSTVEEYTEFFNGAEFKKLFQELIADKLVISQILALLRQKPFSTGELSRTLGIGASEISRYLNIAAKQGLCRFDENRRLIVAAHTMPKRMKLRAQPTPKSGRPLRAMTRSIGSLTDTRAKPAP